MTKLIAQDYNFNKISKIISPVFSSIVVPSISSELGWDPIKNSYRFFDGSDVFNILSNRDISIDTNLSNEGLKLTDRNTIKNYVDNTISSIARFIGSHDASSGLFPTGTIRAGDSWYISVAGTLTGLTPVAQVSVGDMLVARIANPANASGWFVLQSNFDTAQDILVGGTFTPSAGLISGSDNLKTALQKLQGNISASTLTAGSGLTINSNQVKLGGSLSENTMLDGGSSFSFRGANLSSFRMDSSNSTMILSGDSFLVSMGARGVSMDSSGQGFVYLTDLSTTFINESLITKRYADTKAGFYSQSITLVANTPFTITHNLNLKNQNSCLVQVWDIATSSLIGVDVETINVNSLRVLSNVGLNVYVSVVGN